MKSSSIALTLAFGLICGATAQDFSERPIWPNLESESLSSPEATTFPFKIIYESEVALDLSTLGDDDVIVGSQHLFNFRREIGQEPTKAQFVSAEADEAGTRVVASYELARPDDGWEAWGIPRLDVDIRGGSVSDINGRRISNWGVGSGSYNGLNLALDSVHELLVPQRTRIVQVGAVDPFVDFEVTYEANYPLDADLFGSDEVTLYSQELTTVDADGQSLEIGTFTGKPIKMDVADVDASPDNQTMTVTYRASRPVNGWSESGLDLMVLLEPYDLGENASGWYSIGSPGLGYIHPLSEGEPTSALVASSLASEDQDVYTFQVIYEHPAGIDLESLGNDDLSTKPTSKSLGFVLYVETVLEVETRPRLTSTESENGGTRVTATYAFDRPEEGWDSLGSGTNAFISTVDGSVKAKDGTPHNDAFLGRLPLTVENTIAAQIVGFDSWVDALGQSLGFEQPITPSSDADGDGSEDVLELMLGTHPDDPGDIPGLKPEVVQVGETSHFQMTLEQPNTIGAFTVLEGSADGKLWEEALPHFEAVGLVVADESGIITLRSIAPLDGLPYQYFRASVVPVR